MKVDEGPARLLVVEPAPLIKDAAVKAAKRKFSDVEVAT